MHLTLVPLTGESIRALVRGPDEPSTQPELRGGLWPPEDRWALRYRHEALVADPAAWRWLLHAVLDGDRGLVRRFDFVRVGEQWDDEDGLELVFERTLPRAGWTGLG